MQTILNIKDKPNVDEMISFIKGLTVEEQKTIDIFLQAIKFTNKIEQQI